MFEALLTQKSLSNRPNWFAGRRNKSMFHNLNLLQNLHAEIFLLMEKSWSRGFLLKWPEFAEQR